MRVSKSWSLENEAPARTLRMECYGLPYRVQSNS